MAASVSAAGLFDCIDSRDLRVRYGWLASREAAQSQREPQGGLNLCCVDSLMVFAPLMDANAR